MGKILRYIVAFAIILAIVSETVAVFGYSKADWANINNLPPFASMSLSKGRQIDITVANDNTTGYSTAVLNSKLNEILKPKLAEQGVDFKINVVDSADRQIYQEPVRNWNTFYDTGVMSIGGGWTSGLYIDFRRDTVYGNRLFAILHYVGSYNNGYNFIATLPDMDFNSFLYRYNCDYILGGTQQHITKMIDFENEIPIVGIDSTGVATNFRIWIERTPKYKNDAIRGGAFDTGNNFYTMNKIGPYNSDTSGYHGGISGNIYYRITPDNKVVIKSYALDKLTYFPNDQIIEILYYSDYNCTQLLKNDQMIREVDTDSPYLSTQKKYTSDFNDIKDSVKAMRISLTGMYWFNLGNFWNGYGLYRNGDPNSDYLSRYPVITDNIKRKAFVSENLEGISWRENAEKYYVDFSSRAFSEHTYSEGLGSTMALLSEKDIVPVKIGSNYTESDAEKLISNNSSNGRFIDLNQGIDSSILDFANYVLKRVKVNLNLVHDLDILNVNSINSYLKPYLKQNNIDLKYNLVEAKRPNTDAYPRNKFYFGYNYYGDWYMAYYNEDTRDFVTTNTLICDRSTSYQQLLVTSRGTVVTLVGYRYLREFAPDGNSMKLVKEIDVQAGNFALKPTDWWSGPVMEPAQIKFTDATSLSILYRDTYGYNYRRAISINYRTGEILNTSATISLPTLPYPFTSDYPYMEGNADYVVLGYGNLGMYKYSYDSQTSWPYIHTPDGKSLLRPYPATTSYYADSDPLYFQAGFGDMVSYIPDSKSEPGEFDFISYVGNDNLWTVPSPQLATLYSKLTNMNAAFVGIVNNTSKAVASSIVANNCSKGKVISHTNIQTDLLSLANYIISVAKPASTQVENGSYVVVAENESELKFESGGLNNSTGSQEVNSTYSRTIDYIPVESGGTYTINSLDTNLNTLKAYYYNSNSALMTAPQDISSNARFTVPVGACYMKLTCTYSISNANTLVLVDNNAFGGEELKYAPVVSDVEKDNAEIFLKYDHDNRNIAGKPITNAQDKLGFDGVELSTPITKFTKAGTYKISMYAKDIPSIIQSGPNLIPNGNAETLNGYGQPDGWSIWTATPGITTFTARRGDNWVISGYNSFEINTPSRSDDSANVAVYRDVDVRPNSDYKFKCQLSAHRCLAYIVIYEMDSQYNILRSFSGNTYIYDNSNPQNLSIDFRTGETTSKIRVHIVKGNTHNSISGVNDYVFADNLELFKMTANQNFNDYRKASLVNVLENGDAELTNTNGTPTGWLTWAMNSATTYFTTIKGSMWTISGTGSFEIYTPSGSVGQNIATFYREVDAEAITNYQLTGKLGAHRCQGYMYVEEVDSAGVTIATHITAVVPANGVVTNVSSSFITLANTKKLRVVIVKGETRDPNGNNGDYVFADDIKLLTTKTTYTIYAHRLPKAEFSYKLETVNNTFRVLSLGDNGLSFDPDHTDKANNGIVDVEWRWGEIDNSGNLIWHQGKVPENSYFAAGAQVLIWYRVQDSDGPDGKGAWSNPKVVRVDGQLLNPYALFEVNYNPLPMQNQLIISDQSYTPNFGGAITNRNWTIQKSGGPIQTLFFDSSDSVNGKYLNRFNSLGFGKYTITLTVSDSFGRASKPYSQVLTVIDTIAPTVNVNPVVGTFQGDTRTEILIDCRDSTLGNSNNRGLKNIQYVWSQNASTPEKADNINTINIPTEGVYQKTISATQITEGTWYLYVKSYDYAGNTNNGESYMRFGPYNIETVRAGNFKITMMLDIGWRSYYFDTSNRIDDNHDGVVERYLRKPNTDIGTQKLPVNYYGLIGYNRSFIKAGYRVKGRIDLSGSPDYAVFKVKYLVKGVVKTDTITLIHNSEDTYLFEWIIPLETDNNSFVSFDLEMGKGTNIYRNEKWIDMWDTRNTSRQIFYIKGKATDDLTFYQSQ